MVHPVLATGPAAEGYGPALSVVLESTFRNYVAGSVVFIDGLNKNVANSFKRHRTSVKLLDADKFDSTTNILGVETLQPAFFIDTPTAHQESIALQTYGMLTVKVETEENELPAPGKPVYVKRIDTFLGVKKYTILTTTKPASGPPAVAIVLSAERRDEHRATECDCRVFVHQLSDNEKLQTIIDKIRQDKIKEQELGNFWDDVIAKLKSRPFATLDRTSIQGKIKNLPLGATIFSAGSASGSLSEANLRMYRENFIKHFVAESDAAYITFKNSNNKFAVPP